ncbi:MAG: AmmeMemoRadiSam system radical SAM enzyme [Proteobacteria bacterium]|nr:AmmeMemoRadiSam system radical SAM enzyme [Pseudomonadota bacterium]
MGSFVGRYWHKTEKGKIQCDLCPQFCKLKEGQRGICFVRQNIASRLILTTYGRSSGFCIDPVEKKPLNHFYPGTAVLSFGTAGCNLCCKFCQNWEVSTSNEMDRLAEFATPEGIASVAKNEGCDSVALTYNDPVIFLEYAKDVADACHEKGIKVIAVSSGYINPEPGREFFSFVDAVNIDLKGFTEGFYKRLASGKLEPVLNTLKQIYHETDTWLEITTLIIPGENDSDREVFELSKWIVEELSPSVPVHFSAFHPAHKMMDTPATSLQSLIRVREIALEAGLNHVYTGNVHYSAGDTSYCDQCGELLIERDWYTIHQYNLNASGCCSYCKTPLSGRFLQKAGDWGARRKPVSLSSFW